MVDVTQATLEQLKRELAECKLDLECCEDLRAGIAMRAEGNERTIAAIKAELKKRENQWVTS